MTLYAMEPKACRAQVHYRTHTMLLLKSYGAPCVNAGKALAHDKKCVDRSGENGPDYKAAWGRLRCTQ
jgi:hypothetical protein